MAKFLVIYVDVEEGTAEAAYKADQLGQIDGPADEMTQDIDQVNTLASRRTIISMPFTENSPGCRVV